MQTPLTPTIVGRERERSALRGHLDTALAGHGGLVLIAGAAGIGKTALVDALVQEATGAGAQVLIGHCYDRTETPPYGAWRECLAQLHADTPGATMPAVPLPSLAVSPNQNVFFAQVRDFTAALAAERPLVIVLEDVHWADTASLDLLRFLARTLASLPILVVATYRDDELGRRHPLAATIPLLVREASADRLSLGPLDAAAIDALVHARRGMREDDAARLGAYLIKRTGGNPLFVTELLRTLEEERLLRYEGGTWHVGAITDAPVPRLLKQIIDARLIRLGDTEDALLAIAAVIGHSVPLAVWQTVTETDEETLVTLVERAEAAHLVVPWTTDGEGFRFAHALVREALYEGVPAIRRRRLHRRVGEALAASVAPDPDMVAYHFRRAGDERAVAWLMQAAERAENAFARHTATERYEAARELLVGRHGETEETGWLQLRAAVLRRYDDPEAASAQAAQAAQAAEAGGHPRLAAYARIVNGYTLASSGAFGAALRTARTGLDALATLPPPDAAQRVREAPFAAYLHEGPLVVWSSFVGRFAEARADGERLLGDASPLAATREEAAQHAPIWSALAFVYIMQGDLDRAWHADDAARGTHDRAERRRLVIPRIRGAFVREVLACVMDDPYERERILADGEETTRRGMGPQRPNEQVDYAHYLRLPLLVVEGRWQEATRIAEQLWAAYKSYSVRYPRMIALGAIARARGDTAFAWQLVREAFPEGVATEPGDMHFSFALSMQRLAIELALDGGDLAPARQWLDMHDHWLTWSGTVLGRAGERVLRARYFRQSGQRTQAETHARAALAAAVELHQPLALLAAHRVLGELAADAGRFAEAEGHFVEALARADACRAPHERALTLLARADLALASGDVAGAAAALDEVRALCTPLDARPALDRAAALAARLAAAEPAPTAYPGGLSAREAEVLRLVAAGLSNAQVAERLFLSPRTVNSHLTTIYAKLDLPSRAAAVRFALDHGLR